MERSGKKSGSRKAHWKPQRAKKKKATETSGSVLEDAVLISVLPPFWKRFVFLLICSFKKKEKAEVVDISENANDGTAE